MAETRDHENYKDLLRDAMFLKKEQQLTGVPLKQPSTSPHKNNTSTQGNETESTPCQTPKP